MLRRKLSPDWPRRFEGSCTRTKGSVINRLVDPITGIKDGMRRKARAAIGEASFRVN
jgi:hypothetical protein